ncbi:MAG: type II toxin-antitoxin system VapC family toxin [Phycisphaeraceae bacterium]|nr:type II toxin-antitoxin system VapC family toxin [Phycisphaeraceae bacterium]
MPTEAGYLLDTNIVIALIRNRQLGQFIDTSYQLSTGLHRCVISVVTVGELYSLVRYLGWGQKKRETLTEILNELVWTDINHPDLLRAYGELDADCTKGGCNMGKNDAWIAATAQVTGMTVLTTDKDFDYAHSQGMLKRIWIDPKSQLGDEESK